MPEIYNLAEAEKLLREVIMPGDVEKTFEEETVGLDICLPGEAETVTARGVISVAEFQPNPSFGAHAEGGAFAGAGTRKRDRLKFTYTRYSMAALLTGDTLKHMALGGDRKLAALSLARDVASDIKTFKKRCNGPAGFNGDGTGEIGRITAVGVAGANGTITLDPVFGIKFIPERAEIQFVNPAGAGAYRTNGGGAAFTSKVKAVNPTTLVITLDVLPSDVAVGDRVVFKGMWKFAVNGLKKINSNANDDYAGLLRSDYRDLKGTYIDLADTDPGLADFDLLEGLVMNVLGSDDLSDMFWYSSRVVQTTYRRLADGMRRWDEKINVLDLGISDVRHNLKGWFADPDCDDRDLHLLRRRHMRKFELAPLDLVKFGDNYLLPVMTYDANATGSYFDRGVYHLCWYWEVGSTNPGALGRMTGIKRSGKVPSANRYRA
jgi:hypothetical protein